MKRDKYDITFSEYIRARAGYTCERCNKYYGPKHAGLHCSHHFSRRHQATRYDPDNAMALCFACHRWYGENPPESGIWLRKQLGDDHVDALMVKAWSVKKWAKGEKDLIRKELLLKLEKLETV